MGTIKFTPSNEMETREWFAAHLEEFDYSIIKSQSAYPDYVLEDVNGIEIIAEIEFLSDNFTKHEHDSRLCDLIICWKHNGLLPLPVLELSSREVYRLGQGPKNYKPIIKSSEASINAARLYKTAQEKCLNEYKEYEMAFVRDLEADMMAIEIMNEPRKRLIQANRELTEALQHNGFSHFRELHPRELMTMFGDYVLKQYKS